MLRRLTINESHESRNNMDVKVDMPVTEKAKLSVKNLNFYYGSFHALKNINLDIPENKVTAFIGPSGCGKSTLLRTLNRMFELYPEQRAEGQILLDGEDILTSKEDVSLIRAKVGMVFQKPTPFPMSIYDNIAFGVRLFETLSRVEMDERVEWALKKAALWNEVKDKLNQSGSGLSGGQQQRLCIERHRHQAGSAAAGRTLLGAGPDLHRQDRGADPRAQARLHRRDRDPQHAAGRPLLGLHRLHVPGRPDRIRTDRGALHEAQAQGHRGLHHGSFRLIRGERRP